MSVYYLVYRRHTNSDGITASKLIGIYLEHKQARHFIEAQDHTLFDYLVQKVETDDDGLVMGI
jgi:hypothetical protein